MIRRESSLAIVCILAGALAACEYHRTIAYPKVPAAGTTEAAFDCPRLDDAILKTEAVRWVMREDGAHLLSPTQRVERTTSDVAIGVAATAICFFCVPPLILGDEGHHALDGVDRRLVSLLKLKADKQCAASPTGLPGMTDEQMYDELTGLLARETQKPSDDDTKALLAERTRLLDHLRP